MAPVIARIREELGLPTWSEEDPQTDTALASRLWDAVQSDTGHPLLRHFLARLIESQHIPARDPVALARAIQLYSARHIKFFRERPETFQHALRTLAWGIGDCDDKARFVAAALRSVRIPIRLKFLKITMQDGKRVGHVYPLAFLDGKWTALESVREYPLGYDPEAKAREKGFGVSVHIVGDEPDTLHA
jgi:transglutaminase-like putative cysteine protease